MAKRTPYKSTVKRNRKRTYRPDAIRVVCETCGAQPNQYCRASIYDTFSMPSPHYIRWYHGRIQALREQRRAMP